MAPSGPRETTATRAPRAPPASAAALAPSGADEALLWGARDEGRTPEVLAAIVQLSATDEGVMLQSQMTEQFSQLSGWVSEHRTAARLVATVRSAQAGRHGDGGPGMWL